MTRLCISWIALAALGCGELGPTPPTPPDLTPGSISGVVRVGDTTGDTRRVVGARVSFVRATAVASSPSLEPLEALSFVSSLAAMTDEDGVYNIALPPDRYFLYVRPASGARALSGGDVSHRSFVVDANRVLEVDITLSSVSTATATYVGSATCLGCHENHRKTTATAHMMGLRAPGVDNPLQDLRGTESSTPTFTGAIVADGDGDGISDFAQRVVLAFDQLGQVELGYVDTDGSGYLTDGDELTMTIAGTQHVVRLTYGGSRGRAGRQRFIARIDAFHYVLPVRFDEAGADGQRWREVDTENWPPAVAGSFEVKCASCHLTMSSLTESTGARVTSDPGGAFDFDGDGAPDEIGIGCERCHGPGSEHAGRGGGTFGIIQPARLGPAARTALCGQCHQRGSGQFVVDGERTAYPSADVDGSFALPRPGFGPGDLYGLQNTAAVRPNFGTSTPSGFFTPIDLASTPGATWGDTAYGARVDHSMASRQQYFDFTRSRMYQNEFELLSCFSCHAPHDASASGQLRTSAADNRLCLECHNGTYVGRGALAKIAVDDDSSVAANVLRHQAVRTFELMGSAMNSPDAEYDPTGELPKGQCMACHMPKTARGARWRVDADGRLIEGDRRSHTFDVVAPTVARAMGDGAQVAVPNSCVVCHRGTATLDEKYPDFRFGDGVEP